MPQLGLGLRANVSGTSIYDADAVSYFARAGVTDATAKAQISAFAKGLKNLGLWNSSVCWLLKSSQNAGTGTTAYSFGGLGTFNGTLTNGPTWGTNGIVFDGSNDLIALANGTFSSGSSAESFLGFFKPDGGTSSVILGQGEVAGAPNNYYHLKAGATGNDSATMAFTDSVIAASDTSWKSLFQGNTTLGFKGKNGGTLTSFSPLNSINKTGNNCSIGAFPLFGGYFNGTISAIIKINATPSTQLNSDIHNLYISTLSKIPNLDSDADAYISRAGILDPTAQTQINDFVVGIKELGLWNNMVCWPLRSAQNAGTGTTAYSLGGAGTFNGTLTNGPTWGTDGITFDGINDYIQTTLNPANGNISLAFCATAVFPIVGKDMFAVSSDDITNRKICLNWTSAASGLVRLDANRGGTFTDNIIRINDTNTASRVFCQASHDGSNFYVQKDAAAIQSSAYSGSVLGTGANIAIGARTGGGVYYEGNISFVYYMNTSSHSNYTSIYNLYKTTLGTGLGLP
jgi:hypothetical protein